MCIFEQKHTTGVVQPEQMTLVSKYFLENQQCNKWSHFQTNGFYESGYFSDSKTYVVMSFMDFLQTDSFE